MGFTREIVSFHSWLISLSSYYAGVFENANRYNSKCVFPQSKIANSLTSVRNWHTCIALVGVILGK